MIIAGIGSRKTPPIVQRDCNEIGAWCKQNGVYVRSGHAEGADWAFELGAKGYCIAYIPWPGFNEKITRNFCTGAEYRIPIFSQELENIARAYHPAYDTMTQGMKKLMMRNGCQVLGDDLQSPVDFVVCYAPEGTKAGGTSQALRIAEDLGIPILNLHLMSKDDIIIKLEEFLNGNLG